MTRTSLVAVLWISSLVAVAYWRNLEPVAVAQSGSPAFSARRIASDNGFTLVRTYASPQAAECFMLHEGTNGVAMAPAKCP